MIQYIINLKCGDPGTKRFQMLQNSDYQLVFKLFDNDGTPLDTIESWQGRIAKCYIDGFLVFYTNNPDDLYKTLQIENSIVLNLEFGTCRWDVQLVTEDTGVRLVTNPVELPADISCENLTADVARISEFKPSSTGLTKFSLGSGMLVIDGEGGLLVGDSIRTGTFVTQDNVHSNGRITANSAVLSGALSATSVTVSETSAVGSGAVNAQNVYTGGMFTGIMRCDELAAFKQAVELDAKVTIGTDGEFQMNGSAVSMNGDTEIYCPTPKKDGGVTRYSPTVQYLEPPAVQEAGHYLLFKRVYDT